MISIMTGGGGDESTALDAWDEEDGVVPLQHRAVVPIRGAVTALIGRDHEDRLVALQHRPVVPSRAISVDSHLLAQE